MKLLYKILKQNPDSREGIIATTSTLGIIANVLISAIKVVVGLITSSIAIASEGINNAADALTSLLTLVGTKLAQMHPDENHPFGYGRIEYLTSLVISVLILVTGVELLISSIKLIFEPAELTISYVSIAIVAVSAVIKLILGLYTIRMGKKAESTALEAVGLECRNDSIVSVVTIFTAVVFLVFHLSLDAYAGIFTSVLIIKAGYEVLMETVSELIGRPGDHALASKIYREIRSTEGVLGAADMMLHNYGPDAWSGSVNLELDHAMTVGEVYEFIHALQLRIMHEYHVVMVFGIYAVDRDHEEAKAARRAIAHFVKEREHVKSFHAIYFDPESDKLYCDLIVDYELEDWGSLKTEFTEYMKTIYPDRNLELTIETDFV